MPPEDQAEFERVLDEVLLTARLSTGADPEEVARLRELAMNALPEIAATAWAEYARYDRMRQQVRRAESPDAPRTPGRNEARGFGSGLAVVVCALVPVLAGVAAVVFLLLGYALGLADPEPAPAAPMRGVGWVFAVVAACGMLVAAAVLVGAAVRNGSSTAIRASAPGGELARARAEWLRALLDRGITPFLRERSLAALPHHPRGRTPRLRFSSPHFSSPDFSSPAAGRAARPRFGQPQFSRPRFGRPDFTSPAEELAGESTEQPGELGRGDFPGPEFSGPRFTSPEFTSPAVDEADPATRPRFGQPDFSGPDFTSPAEGGQDRD
ncbi:hypothetical protein [Streptomyces hoynatensis]|uniref:hypothetical protein n=1 Tax=Streptomyces hoynatensis TaxID=1141874 RepID=UPI00187E001D|nr:hypothetical protein [Streptomyces hoynatensis]